MNSHPATVAPINSVPEGLCEFEYKGSTVVEPIPAISIMQKLKVRQTTVSFVYTYKHVLMIQTVAHKRSNEAANQKSFVYESQANVMNGLINEPGECIDVGNVTGVHGFTTDNKLLCPLLRPLPIPLRTRGGLPLPRELKPDPEPEHDPDPDPEPLDFPIFLCAIDTCSQ
ncbi:hypothetical protein M9H77_01584 [Catharanthus roseus]|uniref:Uncharacterized protein n=1 Tax=Catharanthus roseus TaxID=4058 RepID=A0ACC0C665_CATRO|nr:hypothetical protein M9H77_01584 [Catharanthus roseus]